MNDEERILVLGALLHDIGKFLQRARTNLNKEYENIDCGYGGAHSKWSAGFVDGYIPENILNDNEKKILNDIILSHHNKERLKYKDYNEVLNVITNSDHLSATEREKREEDETGDPDKEPLLSPFCNISLDQSFKERFYYPIVPLTDVLTKGNEVVYPKKDILQLQRRGYKEIWVEFEEDMMKLNDLNLNFIDYVNSLNYIFFKYLRFIPSAIYRDIPDIPLYDHLKTTAAIAVCKYRAEDKEKPYLLIEGDVSGIQDFIFYAQKPMQSAEKSAKRLRGRSFFINLIVDACVTCILRKLNLFETNILLQSGGHFIILAPNTKNNRVSIEKIKKEFNEYLHKNFGTLLYLAVAYLEGSDEDIKNYSEFREKLSVETEKAKKLKFNEIFDEGFFGNRNRPSVEREICVVCGINKKKEGDLCSVCNNLTNIGDKVADFTHILRYTGNGGDFTIELESFKISYNLFKGKPSSPNGENLAVYSLNSTNFLDKGMKCMRGFKLIGRYVPTDEGRVKSFDIITELEDKNEHAKLAIFKADVDNLGWIFSKGIRKKLRSISRISMLSFLFDLFFSYYINELAERYECYVIFSGGDDLIVAGRFDNIIKFSQRLRDLFRGWVSKNPNITISAGIEMAHYKFPVKRLVEYSDEALEKSKSIKKCERCGSENVEEITEKWKWKCKECGHIFIPKKDKITIFDRALLWQEYKSVIKLVDEFHKNKDELGSGTLYQLMEIHRQSNEDVTSGRPKIPRGSHVPYVKYFIVRNWKGKDKNKRYRLERSILDNFEIIDVAVSLYSLLQRYGLKIGGDKNTTKTT